MHDAVLMRISQSAPELIREIHHNPGLHRPFVEHARQVPTLEVGHHEIRTIGITPEVEQRHDVGMLQRRHQLRLRFEPAHEPGIVRQFGADRLDRHLTTHAGLSRPIHDTMSALADLSTQHIPAQAISREADVARQRSVLQQNPLLEILQLDRWGDPEPLAEFPPQILIRCQCLGLAARPIESHHQSAAYPLPAGILHDEGLQITDRFLPPTQSEQGIEPVLGRPKPEFGQATDLRLRPLLILELPQHRTPPQRQCLVEQAQRLLRIRRQDPACLPRQTLEPHSIHSVGIDHQHIPGRPGHDHARLVTIPTRIQRVTQL